MTATTSSMSLSKQQRVFDFMDALETFVEAKMQFESSRAQVGSEWASTHDLDRARDALVHLYGTILDREG